MRRSPALATLSRDHHHALVIAQKLRRATAETAEEARTAFLDYWRTDGRAHFRLEEEVLLPAYARYGDPYHPLIAQVLCDHVAIRNRADILAGGPSSTLADLEELGSRLADHVRLEERGLFPLIEQTIPEAELAVVVAALS